jgi:hypothetical protein
MEVYLLLKTLDLQTKTNWVKLFFLLYRRMLRSMKCSRVKIAKFTVNDFALSRRGWGFLWWKWNRRIGKSHDQMFS